MWRHFRDLKRRRQPVDGRWNAIMFRGGAMMLRWWQTKSYFGSFASP
jgi:hypothetical protein